MSVVQPWLLVMLGSAVGVLGGFTTFSAFALDALMLVQRGAAGAAAVYVLASVLGCLLAAGVAYAAVATALR